MQQTEDIPSFSQYYIFPVQTEKINLDDFIYLASNLTDQIYIREEVLKN